MAWLMTSVVVVLAVLGPLFGADTRDRLTTPNHFWQRRGSSQNAR